MSEPSLTSHEPATPVAQALRALVDEIAELAQSEREPTRFYAEFLSRVTTALAAHAGGVWRAASAEGWMPDAQVGGLDRVLGLATRRESQQHEQLLAYVAQRKQPYAAAPQATIDAASDTANPTRHVLLLCPLMADDEVLGVMEIVQRGTTSPAAQAGYLRFLGPLCSLAADYDQRHRGRMALAQQQAWQRFNEFVARVYGSLDVPQTAYTIANEGRRYVQCDRLSVAVRHGRRCRVIAVSGEDRVNSRASVVRLMGELATVVARSGESLWSRGDASSLAPQVDLALQAYVDQSHARHLAVVPLPLKVDEQADSSRRGEVLGALILEQFAAGAFSEAQRERAAVVAEHAAASLSNAREHNSVFLLPLWKALGKATWVVRARTLPKTVLGLLLITAAAIALVVVPVDFDIEVRGRLEPTVRREIFVPMDGQIEEVHVAHGQAVQAGEPLVRLRNTQIEYQMTALQGESQTVEKQLAARRATLLTLDRQSAENRTRAASLAAEIEEFSSRQKNLSEQLALLKKQSADLMLKSPIRGQVITWNVTDLLAARPVQRGQSLLRVADTSGPWSLELKVPDRRFGHIRAAHQGQSGELTLHYLLATDPATEYPARIRELEMSADIDEEHGSSVRMTADVDAQNSPSNLRPGVSVIAKIHCGQRSIGYVWFHQLIEFVQSRVLFKL